MPTHETAPREGLTFSTEELVALKRIGGGMIPVEVIAKFWEVDGATTVAEFRRWVREWIAAREGGE